MARFDRSDWAKFILRAAIAGNMLFHGVHKLHAGIPGFEKLRVSRGLPEFLSHGVYVGEVLAPTLMLLGVFTRPASAVFAFNMGIAVRLAHPDALFALGKHGEWQLELQSLYFFGAIVIAIIGGGKISLKRDRWN